MIGYTLHKTSQIHALLSYSCFTARFASFLIKPLWHCPILRFINEIKSLPYLFIFQCLFSLKSLSNVCNLRLQNQRRVLCRGGNSSNAEYTNEKTSFCMLHWRVFRLAVVIFWGFSVQIAFVIASVNHQQESIGIIAGNKFSFG